MNENKYHKNVHIIEELRVLANSIQHILSLTNPLFLSSFINTPRVLAYILPSWNLNLNHLGYEDLRVILYTLKFSVSEYV